MPYISKTERQHVDPMIREVCDVVRPCGRPTGPAGVLNYVVTKLVIAFLGAGPTYARINAAIGALECAKLEAYRRLAAPYEDTKKEENGDVY